MIIVAKMNAFLSKNSCQCPKNQILVDLCNFYLENNAVVDSKSIEKINVLVEKPTKTNKLDIKVHDKLFKPKKKGQNEGKKEDKYNEEISEYISDDENDDDKLYLN